MSRAHAVARLNLSDATLGAFAFVPPSATLDHLVRYLSTWNGTDKLFTLIQYTLKLAAPVLIARSRLQHCIGLRKEPIRNVSSSFLKFADIIGDFRMLGRFCGLLPVLQWMISMERNSPPTRALLNIERLQGWSMLFYYPLEHLYYLRAHDLIPAAIPSFISLAGRGSFRRLNLNAGKLAMWSCRAWTVYVLLQFAHLIEDRKLLLMKERHLKKGKDVSMEERKDLGQRWDVFWNEVVANTANLPLAIHWSLEKGFFSNELWPTIFALVNAMASLRSGWKATALPRQKSAIDNDVGDSNNPLVSVEKQEM
ncbi:hypothetical protein BKA82DRAFT_991927 [Pisolithus tinctorius]|uniref:Uncharacterized protein n=1 Tax=Pisolithus tinctorius Marx 270 TaxID=870435 RepID=A0A0C3PZC7_PISTI|nr:hypothetical protein BKA82DRAFT_991927 [Pisolithus tinctorius]KIO15211.1 hypothetical protein M404DRAFT_991927 [Pisolithus tinctorius Marx 270]